MFFATEKTDREKGEDRGEKREASERGKRGEGSNCAAPNTLKISSAKNKCPKYMTVRMAASRRHLICLVGGKEGFEVIETA